MFRLHKKRNLISQGILPLIFAEEDNYERVSEGDAWKIEAVREGISSGETRLVATSAGGGEIALEARLMATTGTLGRLKKGEKLII